MKVSRILYFISIILFSFPLQAQEEEDIPFVLIEKQARCLYTDDKGNTIQISLKKCLDDWVLDKFRYPQEAIKKKIQGRVELTLLIDNKGVLTIKEVEAKEPILEKEARRIFEGFPQVAPAEQRGKPVPTIYKYPIAFKID
ncbi:energy transducer TonB [uncultured Capnocytophaga sp.]|jgi:hypothetical protein|uniref:energy transducer TonB n=1 Tax=uncultured Capnocytophaga sp. TaxID=159273 RepID=UPI002637393A|nr:energy transducer TonB [uncultured Capnocytophaga sp.]